jgi:anti-sigma factor RsiW
MRCAAVETALSPYIDGELAPRERVRVESHLAVCRRCRARLAGIRAVQADLRSIPRIAVSEGFDARVLAAAGRPAPRAVGRVERAARLLERAFSTPSRRALGAAAAGLLIALIFVLPSTGVEFTVQSMGAAGTAPGSRLSVTVDLMVTTTDRLVPIEVDARAPFSPLNGG